MDVNRPSPIEVLPLVVFHQKNKQVISIELNQDFWKLLLLYLINNFPSTDCIIACSTNIAPLRNLGENIAFNFCDQGFQFFF